MQRLVRCGGDEETTVNSFYDNGSFRQVTGNDVLQALRAACIAIGVERLGFSASEIGTHLICSGAAMSMYLDEVPVYTIMMIGRCQATHFYDTYGSRSNNSVKTSPQE